MDNSIKDRVLEAIDIVAVIGERVQLTRKGRDFVGLCPFHADHKPSLAVSPTKRIFKCWSCGVGGDVIRFVQKIERIEFREALALLAQRAGISLQSSPADQAASRRRAELVAAVAWARDHFCRNLRSTPGGKFAGEYARQRGLTAETLERFAIGYAPDAWDDLLAAGRRAGLQPDLLQEAGLISTNERGRTYDRFRNRLIFPITDTLGRPIAFGGRTLGNDDAKYLNSPETVLFSKARVLYGLHQARSAVQQQHAATVVEGYMDTVLLVQHGFENVVATLGTALTDAHAKLLRPLADRVYLCFDSDAAGIRAAERALEVALRTQLEVRVVVLDGDKDPADCVQAGGAGAFASQLTKARDALEFKWSQALRGLGRQDPYQRRAAVEEFVQFVAGVVVAGGVDPLQQDLLVGRLSSVLGVPPEEVFDLLTRAKRAVRRARPAPESASAGGASEYEAELRGLPAGLVTAMETVLGLLVADHTCWVAVSEHVARGARLSKTWSRLYQLLVDVHSDLGEYSLREVLERCEHGDLFELIERTRSRARGLDPAPGGLGAEQARLAAELDALELAHLRDELRSAGGADEGLFERLRERARGRDGPLAPEQQRRASAPAS